MKLHSYYFLHFSLCILYLTKNNKPNNDGGTGRTRRQSLSIYLVLDAITDLVSDRKINMTGLSPSNKSQFNRGIRYFNKKHYDLDQKLYKVLQAFKGDI